MSETLVMMEKISGIGRDAEGHEIQWFEYKPSFFGPIVRVEWDLSTMAVGLSDENVVNYLLSNKYARKMTDSEAKEYYLSLEKSAAETPPSTPLKGDAP